MRFVVEYSAKVAGNIYIDADSLEEAQELAEEEVEMELGYPSHIEITEAFAMGVSH